MSLNFDPVIPLLGCVLKRCTKKSTADMFEKLTNIQPDHNEVKLCIMLGANMSKCDKWLFLG